MELSDAQSESVHAEMPSPDVPSYIFFFFLVSSLLCKSNTLMLHITDFVRDNGEGGGRVKFMGVVNQGRRKTGPTFCQLGG